MKLTKSILEHLRGYKLEMLQQLNKRKSYQKLIIVEANTRLIQQHNHKINSTTQHNFFREFFDTLGNTL